MQDSVSLRPGILLGSYPQRLEPPLGKLETLVARGTGLFRQYLDRRTAHSAGILRQVERHAVEIDALGDAALEEVVADLREQLGTRGFDEQLVARAFALVRELSRRILGMRHFDVQLIGGWVMLNGMVAEMQTGEGKTLTAALPAAVAALSGIPVHVVTVNDYLVTRDAAMLQPLYNALGLSVATITEEMSPEQRRAAYACDITYTTNKQLVFDYLKDRIKVGQAAGRLRQDLKGLHSEERQSGLLLRGLCFAIVDEVDSVLIDEARTPLIISRSSDSGEQQRLYGQALGLAAQLRQGVDYRLEARERRIELTAAGRRRVEELARPFSGIWQGARRRENLVQQALTAMLLFVRDQHYLVADGKVQIIDEYTGRVMPDRSWEAGLHQMIEAKEGCDITTRPETLARISYQRFFRRYLRLAGMSGTAQEVSAELTAVYNMRVMRVPTNRPLRRTAGPTGIHRSSEQKWAAIVARVAELHAAGRPVLVGTRSVAASEHLSRLLDAAGLPHQVLNARQDSEEAGIIERAGEIGRITVATNMAGRGTDIHLAGGVAELGGLHVILTERHEARRIDRQLTGRCGRQGDPGSYESMLSLQDELVKEFYPQSLLAHLGRWGASPSRAGRAIGRLAMALPQRAAELRHARIRRNLLEMDEHLGRTLAFSGRPE
jgi:preprotein translocase subunit SecA